MIVLIISIVITVVLAIAILGVVIYNVLVNEISKLWFLTTPLAFLGMLILLFGSFCKVSANEVGIIYDDHKGILEETIGEGFRTKSIFWHLTKINTSNRVATIETTGQTNDGQYAEFTLSIVYRIEKENAGKFYKKTNSVNLSEEQLDTLVKQALQSNTIKYNIFELLSEGLETARIEFENSLANLLLENYYVTVVSTSFDDVDAGTNIEAILQQKAEAEQRIEIARKEAEANMIVAENEVRLAEQKALVEKTLAEAEAFAITSKGQANAQSATAYINEINNMIENIQGSTGLTYKDSADLVLSIVFYDTWNGELPQVLTSDSLSSLIGALLNGKN